MRRTFIPITALSTKFALSLDFRTNIETCFLAQRLLGCPTDANYINSKAIDVRLAASKVWKVLHEVMPYNGSRITVTREVIDHIERKHPQMSGVKASDSGRQRCKPAGQSPRRLS
jgi:hypothetical protein